MFRILIITFITFYVGNCSQQTQFKGKASNADPLINTNSDNVIVANSYDERSDSSEIEADSREIPVSDNTISPVGEKPMADNVVVSEKPNDLSDSMKEENLLEGFKKAEELDSLDEDQLTELYATEEKIFTFEETAETDTDFSEPIMVSGASLSMEKICKNSAYQESEPSFKDIADYTNKANTCGEVKMVFCLRTKNRNNKETSYSQTPEFDLKVPCFEDSFADLSFELVDGQYRKNAEEIGVNISVSTRVTDSESTRGMEVYLTDSPSCEDGAWSDIGGELRKVLHWTEGKATVYLKFRDRFQNESNCRSATISFVKFIERYATQAGCFVLTGFGWDSAKNHCAPLPERLAYGECVAEAGYVWDEGRAYCTRE